MIITLAADCDSSIGALARLGWPGVIALAIVAAAVVACVWLVNR